MKSFQINDDSKRTSSSLPTRVIDEARFRYSLDIISDGSAYTGHGTLLFSILRRSSSASVSNVGAVSSTSNNGDDCCCTNDKEEEEEEVIMKRYAFGYCENMGRLVQDQKQKISKVTAVFVPTSDVKATAGIPSLLLALSDAGSAEQISIIGPPLLTKYINFTTNMILRNRLYPKVNVCEVPAPILLPQQEEATDATTTKKRKYCGETKEKTAVSNCNRKSSSWWNVYHDEYMHVYARTYNVTTSAMSSSSSIPEVSNNNKQYDDKGVAAAYLVTVLGSDETSLFSFSVAPKHVQLAPLPESLVLPTSLPKPLKFSIYWTDFVPVDTNQMPNSNTAFTSLATFRYEVNKKISVVCKNHNIDANDGFNDIDDGSLTNEWDIGILRSSTALGKRLHTLLPCVFPYSRAISRIEQEVAKHEQPLNNKLLQRRSNSNDLTSDDNEIIRLHTGDSLRLNRLDSPLTKPRIVSFPYRQNIKRGNTKLTFSTTKAVADFLHSISTDCPQRDENEISLSEDETTELPDKAAADCLQQEEKERIYLREEGAIDLEVRSLADNAKTVHPHLLVLGTGCAAPSSLRGSSAYAIFLPFSHHDHAAALNSDNNSALALFALLDCGEGCLTSLAQYSPHSISLRQSLLSLKFIWISHSHLDHYGGLATIIEAIDDASYSDCEDLDKPIVVAPLKVLQYLDECLGCVNGVLPNTSNNKNTSNKMMHRLFYGTTHREFQSNSIRSGGNTVREKLFSYKLRHSTTQQLWQPVAGLKNVPVEHCPYSYSLIIDFQYPEIEGGCDKIKTFSLCYSGDCRPSSKLISECQRHRQRPDLVIHEATFDDDMRQEAIAKRHSTVSEALEVVSKMGVKACLLSHFSQRYPHTSKKYVFKYSSQDHANNSMLCTVKFCSAYDGLFLPLSEKFLTTSLALLNSAMASFLNPIE